MYYSVSNGSTWCWDCFSFPLCFWQAVEILPSSLVLFILRKLPPKRGITQYHPIRWKELGDMVESIQREKRRYIMPIFKMLIYLCKRMRIYKGQLKGWPLCAFKEQVNIMDSEKYGLVLLMGSCRSVNNKKSLLLLLNAVWLLFVLVFALNVFFHLWGLCALDFVGNFSDRSLMNHKMIWEETKGGFEKGFIVWIWHYACQFVNLIWAFSWFSVSS